MVTAIVLAAGSSTRMGDANKLLLPYKNKSVVAHVVHNIIAAGISEVVVVTGYELAKLQQALTGLPVKFALNENYISGMTGSIQQGVMHATGNGYMICLSDMVLIDPAEYSLLADTFNQKLTTDPTTICIPVFNDEKGNPVIFSSFYRQLILRHEHADGCKEILRSNRENIVNVAMSSGHVLRDMDFPEDYHRLQNETEQWLADL